MAGAPTFDPATAERTFRFAAPDLFVALAGPGLRALARSEAPTISFTFTSPAATDRGALETGDLDLRILPEMAEVDVGDAPAGHLRRRGLLREGFRAFVGREGSLGERRRLLPPVATEPGAPQSRPIRRAALAGSAPSVGGARRSGAAPARRSVVEART